MKLAILVIVTLAFVAGGIGFAAARLTDKPSASSSVATAEPAAAPEEETVASTPEELKEQITDTVVEALTDAGAPDEVVEQVKAVAEALPDNADELAKVLTDPDSDLRDEIEAKLQEALKPQTEPAKEAKSAAGTQSQSTTQSPEGTAAKAQIQGQIDLLEKQIAQIQASNMTQTAKDAFIASLRSQIARLEARAASIGSATAQGATREPLSPKTQAALGGLLDRLEQSFPESSDKYDRLRVQLGIEKP